MLFSTTNLRKDGTIACHDQQEFIIKEDHFSTANIDFSSLKPDDLSEAAGVSNHRALLHTVTSYPTLHNAEGHLLPKSDIMNNDILDNSISSNQHIQSFKFDTSSPSLLSTSNTVAAPSSLLLPQQQFNSTTLVTKTSVHEPAKTLLSAVPSVRRKRKLRRKPRFKCNICAQTFIKAGRYQHHM